MAVVGCINTSNDSNNGDETMNDKNIQKYSLPMRLIHWLVTVVIVGLFASGIWMVELDYYSDWYQSAPELHMLVGFILLAMMLLRIVWRIRQPKLPPVPELKRYELIAAHVMHILLYLLTFVILFSGILIAIAGDETVSILGLFDLPNIGSFFARQQDVSGEVHFWAAWFVMIFASVHALAALKHHFINKDVTLRRML